MEITTNIHILMLIISCVIIYLVLEKGKKSIEDGQLSSYDKKIGIGVITIWLCYDIYSFLPGNFDWATSLPLHLCDITAFFSAIAIIHPSKMPRAILYYWAFTFSLQAFFFPIGDQDPRRLRFWFFWFLHIGILSCSLYDIIIRNYRPKFYDLFISILVGTIYICILFPINYLFKWNYAYIGNIKPNIPTPIDLLGPWPLRVLWMYLLIIFFQFLITIPWYIYPMLIKKYKKYYSNY
ncbi:hypothetical protein DBT_1635 [Dissulfuribacter thermophilus]|uniref:Integral membrane protein n=1 Tax=Dissulfuribacter thermophilus TaxID=1156395 RepID=A0A1B9F4I3_9BACT|nr:TIGR02206 family membrane protein [Dissulfuribacter thermophilus]OCC14840.1 hypothetical protein DBT_1635 [Dissulfuribacter thermophilus]